MVAAAHFRKLGQKRNKVLAPDSAHGTNPASAKMAGFEFVTVKSTPEGNVNLADLKSKLDDQIAVFMDQAMASIASHWPPVETLNVQQVEHYAPGIRPIRESFEVALDALLKTLPGKKDTTRPTQPQALQPLELLHIA